MEQNQPLNCIDNKFCIILSSKHLYSYKVILKHVTMKNYLILLCLILGTIIIKMRFGYFIFHIKCTFQLIF